jgi:uncharacterized protein HemX
MHPILSTIQAKLLASVVALLTAILAAAGTIAYHAQREERRQVQVEQEARKHQQELLRYFQTEPKLGDVSKRLKEHKDP